MGRVAIITGISGQDGSYLAELLIKKNSSRSLNILYDFLIETAKAKI